MALTTEATTIIPESKKPSGWTDPATTITFVGTPIRETFTVTIAAAGVTDAASETTGLTNLIAAVKTWVDATWVPTILKLDTTLTIDGIIKISNFDRDNGEATETAKLYLTGTDGFNVIGSFEYE